jgi:AraC family transcriptional regulator
MSQPLSYADYYRSTYPFEQQHRSVGGLNLFRSPRHEAGESVKFGHGHGISLQISRAPRPGQCVVDFGTGRFTADLSAPNYLVAPPDHACKYDLSSDIDLLVIEFSSEVCWDHPWLQDCGPLHHGARYDTLPLQLAERLWELSAHGLTQLEAESLGMGLATLLARASRLSAATKPQKGGLTPRELKLLTEYIKDRIASDLSLGELAALVSRSPFHFARAFKVSMGVPPHRYVLLLRLELAKELLVGGPLSVTQVAHACGFASSQHMATVFRRTVGTTPTEYRRQRNSRAHE